MQAYARLAECGMMSNTVVEGYLWGGAREGEKERESNRGRE